MDLPKNDGLTINHVTQNSEFLVSFDDMLDETYSENWTSPADRIIAGKNKEYWTIRWKPSANADWYECHASSLDTLLDYVNDKY
jgi:hypothetical protein